MTPAGWGVAAGAVAAAVWGLAGAKGLPAKWRLRVAALALLASAGLIIRAAFSPPVLGPAFRLFGAVYAIACAFEVAGVAAAVALLRAPERRGLLAPVVAIVTGLHLIGLWLATGQRLFFGVTLGLCAAGLIALGWPRREGGFDPRLPIAGLGSALVLWAACLSSLV